MGWDGAASTDASRDALRDAPVDRLVDAPVDGSVDASTRSRHLRCRSVLAARMASTLARVGWYSDHAWNTKPSPSSRMSPADTRASRAASTTSRGILHTRCARTRRKAPSVSLRAQSHPMSCHTVRAAANRSHVPQTASRRSTFGCSGNPSSVMNHGIRSTPAHAALRAMLARRPRAARSRAFRDGSAARRSARTPGRKRCRA